MRMHVVNELIFFHKHIMYFITIIWQLAFPSNEIINIYENGVKFSFISLLLCI